MCFHLIKQTSARSMQVHLKNKIWPCCQKILNCIDPIPLFIKRQSIDNKCFLTPQNHRFNWFYNFQDKHWKQIRIQCIEHYAYSPNHNEPIKINTMNDFLISFIYSYSYKMAIKMFINFLQYHKMPHAERCTLFKMYPIKSCFNRPWKV